MVVVGFGPEQKSNLTHNPSERNLKDGISDVAITSVHSEKSRLKKLIMIIIIIMNLSQEMTVFGRRQKVTSAMKQRPEK